MGTTEIYKAALTAWTALQPFQFPPASYVTLWQEQGRQIVIDDQWGPPIPYPASIHDMGTNHGYTRTKGRPDVIDALAEVQGWPEYAEALKIINAKHTALESVGCEKHYSDSPSGEAVGFVGSYTDVIFSEPPCLIKHEVPSKPAKTGAHLEKPPGYRKPKNPRITRTMTTAPTIQMMLFIEQLLWGGAGGIEGPCAQIIRKPAKSVKSCGGHCSGMAIKEPSGSWTAVSSPCARMAKCWIKVKDPKAPAMLRIVEGGW